VYEYRFKLCELPGSGMMVSGWVKRKLAG